MPNWKHLTDEDRDAAFNSMPNMLDGFMKLWGWLHFAQAIEQKVHEKNAHLSGETEAQREEVCAAWADLPPWIFGDPRVQRLYRALGGVRQDESGKT